MKESQNSLPPDPYIDVIDFGAVFASVWDAKWPILGITLVAMLLSTVTVMLMPDVYRAQSLLAPNEDSGASGLSALAAQYGGLAGLAGIDLGGSSSNKSDYGLEVLKSRKFLSEFIGRHQMKVPLIAADGWTLESGELEIDSALYDASTDTWVRKVRLPRKVIPSDQEAYEEIIDNVLSVRQDGQTGFVTVSIEHYSPTLASEWANSLVRDLNETIMRQDVEEAEQSIKYLNEQLQATSRAELRNVFYGLIEEQTKTVMLANVSEEYLFRTIDPAVPPEEPARPKRLQIVIVITLLASLLGTILVVLVTSREKRSNSVET